MDPLLQGTCITDHRNLYYRDTVLQRPCITGCPHVYIQGLCITGILALYYSTGPCITEPCITGHCITLLQVPVLQGVLCIYRDSVLQDPVLMTMYYRTMYNKTITIKQIYRDPVLQWTRPLHFYINFDTPFNTGFL